MPKEIIAQQKPDGGPAFPRPFIETRDGAIEATPESGMSLRDYFAAAALQGICAGPTTWPAIQDCPEIARRSFALADAMIAERAQ